jgi:hypothetical protein
MQWGDQYISPTPPRLLRRKSDGTPIRVALVDANGTPVEPTDLENVAA